MPAPPCSGGAAATLVRAGGKSGAAVLVVPTSLADAAGSPRRAAQAVVEGAVLAAYRFVSHKSDGEGGGIERFVVAGAGLDAAELAEGTRRGRGRGRRRVPGPGPRQRAAQLVDARRASPRSPLSTPEGRPGVTVEVWDEQRIADERLGGLLGVARGSAEPPRLLKVAYEPADPVTVDGRVPHVVLVGKGITFDSGGLSLKTADGMVTMKTDMSGAAAVLAAVSACGELGVRVRVTAIAPTTENMPGGRATKPGDVLTIRNGQTIEVLNTDAEGRLVLADGLTLAAELQPDAIIDLATLTGACVVALGSQIAGLFGSDDALIGRVRAASDRAGEGTWPLPLPDEYRSHIDSEIADMKNVGKAGQAGAIAAALLLARFVDGVPWVHLDIAGPARSDEDNGILTKGGTGFGVRTLLELLEAYGSERLSRMPRRRRQQARLGCEIRASPWSACPPTGRRRAAPTRRDGPARGCRSAIRDVPPRARGPRRPGRRTRPRHFRTRPRRVRRPRRGPRPATRRARVSRAGGPGRR